MEQISVKASIRDAKGKQKVKALRNQGFVPGVVYHRGEEPVSISLEKREITKIIHDAAGENVLINLTIEKEKKKSRAAIIKEVQYEPVKRFILHVDFNEISLNEAITVEVGVVPQGEPIGVKQDGGVIEHPTRMLKIQCLPMDIPKHIDVDVSAMGLNTFIHVKDLKVSSKIKVLTDPEVLLFHVKTPAAIEETPVDAAAAAPELEVIREKKEEEGKPGEKKEAPKAEAPKADKK